MTITIRKARPSDAEELVMLWVHGVKSGNWCFIGGHKIPVSKAQIEAESLRLRGALAKKRKPSMVRFVAYDTVSKKLVGNVVGSWRPDSRMRHVVSCGWGVHPEFQKQGVGTALLSALVAYAQEAGFKRIEAEVAEENVASIHLAKRLGFVAEGIRKSAFLTDDGRCIDMVMMGRLLAVGDLKNKKNV